MGGELPADDPAAEHVEDEGEEDDPLPAAQVGQVGDPQLVGPLGGEVALDEVGPPSGLGIGPRRPPRLAASLRPLDALAAHQPLHVPAPDELAGATQRLPRAPVAVGVVVGGVDLADALEQALVVDRPLRALSAVALEVGGRRHVQGSADELDSEV